jgi:hypothetical protein
VNGVSPAKEPPFVAAASARPSVAACQPKAVAVAASGVPVHRSNNSSLSSSSGQPAPLNFSLPHAGSSAEEKKKQPEEVQSRSGSGGLYRPYSTSPTPSRTLPGTGKLPEPVPVPVYDKK